ncbi:hypothetical protein [uncultured Enterococcus sp.]|uniref:hypothetical protein n=1 Tax=uncultured Enterococcus sp. TaxID=167972 RepID=UPI0025E008E5|nr:hypothetical protein [uncultured Enterococcus sp.]
MKTIATLFKGFDRSIPFLLSNTLIIVPFILYLSLSDGEHIYTILPFVLFYTFRMTAIFLVRGLQTTLNNYTILVFSLGLGGLGAFLGVLGSLNPLFYTLSGAFLGFSAAWFTPAYLTMSYQHKAQQLKGYSNPNYLWVLIFLIALLVPMSTSGGLKIPLTLGVYTLLFILAYRPIRHYPHQKFPMKKPEHALIAKKELSLFVGFFVLLLLLRSSRLLINQDVLLLTLIGITLLFMISIWSLSQSKRYWKLPLWLNLLTFLNGMFGNLLFLFCSLYIKAVYGGDKVTLYLYLPYVLGLFLAMFLTKKVHRLLPRLNPLYIQLAGLALGFIAFLLPIYLPFTLLILSFFRNGTSSWLNQTYYDTEELPSDRRIAIKFTTQNKGSMTHQFLSMILILAFILIYRLPLDTFFGLTDYDATATKTILLMETVKNSLCVLSLILVAYVAYILPKTDNDL